MPLTAEAQVSEEIGEQSVDMAVVSNDLFIEIVKKNYPMYLNKCLTYVKCPSIAEDAVQEGVLAAHKNLPSIRSEKALPAWLYRIILRKAIDLLHKNNRLILIDDQESQVTYNKHGFLNEPMWAEMSNPEEEIIKNEGIEHLKKALSNLDNSYRIPLLLKDYEGFSIKETAEMIHISETNTKVRIHRARIKLKAQLNNYFFPEQMSNLK